MSSGTVERPSEPMLGVDESKDINAFYHNTAYRVRWSLQRLAGADGARAPPPTLPPDEIANALKPQTNPKQHKNRRAASPSTSRR